MVPRVGGLLASAEPLKPPSPNAARLRLPGSRPAARCDSGDRDIRAPAAFHTTEIVASADSDVVVCPGLSSGSVETAGAAECEYGNSRRHAPNQRTRVWRSPFAGSHAVSEPAMITTVVFDLDDTLYDEIDYCRSGLCAVARFLGKVAPPACSDDVFACLWRHFTAGNRTRTFDAAMEELGLPCDEGRIAQLVEVYRNHQPQVELPADSRRTLDALQGRYSLALLTDGFLPAQRLKVAALGIESRLDAIVYTEELGRSCWKPSPAGFERLIETLATAPDRMAYVADNERKDFIAPNRLGMLTIQVVRPRRLHADPGGQEGSAAAVRTGRIEDLPSLLVRY